MTVLDQELSVTIAEDGTLILPPQALEALGTRQVRLSVRDGEMTIRPRPKYLHEIEDVDERMRAFDQFVAGFARETGVVWPAGYNARDDLYD